MGGAAVSGCWVGWYPCGAGLQEGLPVVSVMVWVGIEGAGGVLLYYPPQNTTGNKRPAPNSPDVLMLPPRGTMMTFAWANDIVVFAADSVRFAEAGMYRS